VPVEFNLGVETDRAVVRVIDPCAGLAELTLTRPDNGDTDRSVRYSR
jgi:hypothetical protein